TKQSFDPERIGSYILDNIYEKYDSLQLYSLSVLKRIYMTEIKRNDAGIWAYDKEKDIASYNMKLVLFLEESQKDILKHLELLSKYLIRERRKRLIVIIDNVDQFNDLIQEQVFVFAHSLTKSSFCGSVITLREGYFRQ